MIKRFPLAVPLTLLAGACTATQVPLAGSDSDRACRAGGLEDLAGQPATSALAMQALRRAGAKTVRWIQPGSAVTMDYRRDRLDIHLDEHNVTAKFTCG